jgi:hypothetical protein
MSVKMVERWKAIVLGDVHVTCSSACVLTLFGLQKHSCKFVLTFLNVRGRLSSNSEAKLFSSGSQAVSVLNYTHRQCTNLTGT